MKTTALLCASLGLLAGWGSLGPVAPSFGEGPRIALETVYVTDFIAGTRAHRVRVSGHLGGACTVELDVNTCALDAFGDATICTRIATQAVAAKMVRVALEDSSGRGRRLYRLQGDFGEGGPTYFVVIPRRRSEPHRLIVETGKDKRFVYLLEPLPVEEDETPEGKLQLCGEAKYRAEHVGGNVILYARGEHTSGGHAVFFEQLPLRIWPPQYRLVHRVPTGATPQVITPFEVSTSFSSKDAVKSVTVHDANGKHVVPVVDKR